MCFFETDVEVEEAGGITLGPGVGVVSLVGEDANRGGREDAVGEEGPDVG